jgi:hypothetical protein
MQSLLEEPRTEAPTAEKNTQGTSELEERRPDREKAPSLPPHVIAFIEMHGGGAND